MKSPEVAADPIIDDVASAPSGARFRVIQFGMALAVLSYIDRVTISQAAPLISHDLHFSKSQMGSVFAAFLTAYAIFEVPSAWYGDRVGARRRPGRAPLSRSPSARAHRRRRTRRG